MVADARQANGQTTPGGGLETTIDSQIRRWWRQAYGDEPDFPLSTAQVFDLLGKFDYEINRKRLDYLVGLGFPTPKKLSGSMLWSADDIGRLVMQCDQRRWWKPMSDIHDHKKSPEQRGRELAKATGGADAARDAIAKYSLRDLILLLLAGDGAPERESLFAAIEEKLEQLGVDE